MGGAAVDQNNKLQAAGSPVQMVGAFSHSKPSYSQRLCGNFAHYLGFDMLPI